MLEDAVDDAVVDTEELWVLDADDVTVVVPVEDTVVLCDDVADEDTDDVPVLL